MPNYVEYIKVGGGESWPVRDVEAHNQLTELDTVLQTEVEAMNDALDITNAAIAGKAPASYVDVSDTIISESDIWDYITNAIENMNDYSEKRMAFMDYDNGAVFVSIKRADSQSTVVALVTEEVVSDSGPHFTRKMVAKYDSDTSQWAYGEWEYDNPPMVAGVEYRTTERHRGLPVYVQLVDCGQLPNKNVEYTPAYYGAEDVQSLICKNDILYLYPYTYNTNTFTDGDFSNFPNIAGGTNVVADIHWNWTLGIVKRTQTDFSMYKLMVVLKYTKEYG